VSLLSADRVRLSVGAERLHCVRLHGWFGTPGASTSFPLTVQDGVLQCEELCEWLGKGRGRLDVVLSNAWVRYVILPWQDALASEQLAGDFARALFQEQYGDISASWHVTLSAFLPGRPRIAVAFDTRWYQALQEMARRCGLTLASLRPALSAVLDRIGPLLPADALLAMVEPRRFALLHIEQGEWGSVHNRMLPANWPNHLPGFITQASAALGALAKPLFIVAPQLRRPDLGQLQGTWLRLPPNGRFDPRRDLDWSMCLGV
jgi:hypothetical protein